MNIMIDENTRITSDAYNIVIEERKVAGKDAKIPGEERWTPISYHGTLGQAIESLFNRNIRMSAALELGELLKVVRETADKLEKAVSIQ